MARVSRRVFTPARGGFTLIELAIVLVIIGLIVGGILVGQDLIRSSEVRAAIAQIERYNTSVNTFKGKYGALPGDMPYSVSNSFGFTAYGRTATVVTAQGDNNGLIDGGCGTDTTAHQLCQGYGETAVFWNDLSSTAAGGIIEGRYATATEDTAPGTAIDTTTLDLYEPQSKLGRGNYVYVFESGNTNYFGIAAITGIDTGGVQTAGKAMTVSQAYNIDKKIDDGFPATGNTQAKEVTAGAVSATNGVATGSLAATSCYDSTLNVYALAYAGSATCALTFKFQ